jgi:hypothetical protein
VTPKVLPTETHLDYHLEIDRITDGHEEGIVVGDAIGSTEGDALGLTYSWEMTMGSQLELKKEKQLLTP